MAESGDKVEPAEEQQDKPEEFTDMFPRKYNNMFGSLFALATAKPQVKTMLTKNWFSIIRRWYPNFQTKVYTSPPIHFNTVTYKPLPEKPDHKREPYLKFGMRVCIPSPYSSTKSDEAQQRVLWAFSEYAQRKGLVAFLVSNMTFQNYLNKDYSWYEEDAQQTLFKPEKTDEGEADVVMIDKNRGIFVFEVKSIGDSDAIWEVTARKKASGNSHTTDDGSKNAQFQELHDRFQKKVGKQVKKGKEVVQKLVSDFEAQQKIDVRGGFILANVKRSVFKDALEDFQATKNDSYKLFMERMEVPTIDELMKITMCYDDLPERHMPSECGLSEEVFQSMDRVMQAIMALPCDGDHRPMSDDLYEQVVARFVGPLTTVKIYTEKTYPRVKLEVNTKMHKDKRGKVKMENKVKLIAEEAITKAGAARIMARRFSELVLLEEQISILQKNEDFVHLEGAPGTGKTLMLLLRVLTWLDSGHMVWVLSLSPPSRSVTHVMMEQIKKMVRMYNNTKEKSDKILSRLRMFMMTRPEKSLDEEYFKRLLLKFKLRATGTKCSEAAGSSSKPSDPSAPVPQDRKVCLVVDESGMAGKGLAAFFDWIERAHREKLFRRDNIADQGMSIWSASVEKVGRPQYVTPCDCTNEGKLGVLYDLKMPLRCPPSVQRALMLVQPFLNQENICCFTKEMTLSHPDRQKGTESREMYAADGLPVFLIAHGSHKDPSIDIWFCYECGEELADYLQNTLRIGEEECDCEGKPVIYEHIKKNSKCPVCRKLTKGSLPAADLPLKYNDVMIVATQRAFQFSVPIGKFALALAKKNLKVAINTTREEGDAPIPKEDVILIADVTSIHGLERAIIVVIPEVNPPPALPGRYRGLLYPEPIIKTRRKKRQKQNLPEKMEKILKEREAAGKDVTFTGSGELEEDFPDDIMDSTPVGMQFPEPENGTSQFALAGQQMPAVFAATDQQAQNMDTEQGIHAESMEAYQEMQAQRSEDYREIQDQNAEDCQEIHSQIMEAQNKNAAEQDIQAMIERNACIDPEFVKQDSLLKNAIETREDLTVTGHGQVEDGVTTDDPHMNTEDPRGNDVEMRDEASSGPNSLCQPHSSTDAEIKDMDFSTACTASGASQDVAMETESGQPCGQDAGEGNAEAEPTYVYKDAFTATEITAAIKSLSPQSQQDLFYIGSRAVCQMILVHLGKRTGSD